MTQEPTNILSDSSFEVADPAFQPRTISPSNFDTTEPSVPSNNGTSTNGSPNLVATNLPRSLSDSTSVLSNLSMYYGNRTPDMLPMLGSKTAPRKFRGNFKKVKDFLEIYERMCNAYHVSDSDKCARLKDYCSYKVTQLLESLSSYQHRDWRTLKGILLDYYDVDLKETRYNIKRIRKFVVKWRRHTISSLKSWKRYQRDFVTISGWLRHHEKITKQEEASYFWHGIHKELRNKIEATLTARTPDVDLTHAFSKDNVDSIARLIFARNRFDTNLIDSDDDSERTESEDSSSEESSSSSGSESDTESSGESDRSRRTKDKKKRKLTNIRK